MKKEAQLKANKITENLDVLNKHLIEIQHKKTSVEITILFQYIEDGYSRDGRILNKYLPISDQDLIILYEMKIKSEIERLQKEYDAL